MRRCRARRRSARSSRSTWLRRFSPALEASQGQMDSSFSELSYKCRVEKWHLWEIDSRFAPNSTPGRLRTTYLLECEVVSRRARISGSRTFVPFDSRLESNAERKCLPLFLSAPRYRANSAHTRESRPDSSLGLQVELNPSSCSDLARKRFLLVLLVLPLILRPALDFSRAQKF